MTVDALAGAHAGGQTGGQTGGSDASGDDTYETARTFESLGVSPELNKALADEGIVSAFPIQALTVADALAGRDVCGKAKTGSGKTLAFGVPLLQRAKATREAQGARPASRPARPLGLVLLPTRELAVQVHDVLAPLALEAGTTRGRRLWRRRHRPSGEQASQGRGPDHRHAWTPHRSR